MLIEHILKDIIPINKCPKTKRIYHGVYIIIIPISKCLYIGESVDINQRIKAHHNQLDGYLGNHAKNCSFKILKIIKPMQDEKKLKRKLIKLEKRWIHNFTQYLNLNCGIFKDYIIGNRNKY